MNSSSWSTYGHADSQMLAHHRCAHLLPSFGASNAGNYYGAAFQSALFLDMNRTMKVLFVCTANKLRSPTAESVFSAWEGIETASAGTSPDAPLPLSKELVASADVIFAMEPHHRDKIRKKFKKRPTDARIITLHIPDEYERDDPELIALLEDKVGGRLKALLADQD